MRQELVTEAGSVEDVSEDGSVERGEKRRSLGDNSCEVGIWEAWAARCSPEGLLLVNAVHRNIVHLPRQPSWQMRFRMAASSAFPR